LGNLRELTSPSGGLSFLSYHMGIIATILWYFGTRQSLGYMEKEQFGVIEDQVKGGVESEGGRDWQNSHLLFLRRDTKFGV
jgi:hypothetical protein